MCCLPLTHTHTLKHKAPWNPLTPKGLYEALALVMESEKPRRRKKCWKERAKKEEEEEDKRWCWSGWRKDQKRGEPEEGEKEKGTAEREVWKECRKNNLSTSFSKYDVDELELVELCQIAAWIKFPEKVHSDPGCVTSLLYAKNNGEEVRDWGTKCNSAIHSVCVGLRLTK